MQYAPTRVRAKFGGFHFSPPGYPKNAPGFTFPNKDAPKPRPVLYLNLRRGGFQGVCNTPLHGYVHNLTDFIFPPHEYTKNPPGFRPKPSARIVSGRMLLRPTRIRAKFGGFHISAHGYVKNAPDFTLPNRDTPKTRPVLEPNLRRRIVLGRMLLRPYTGTCKICSVSHFRTRMRPNPVRFHPSQ